MLLHTVMGDKKTSHPILISHSKKNASILPSEKQNIFYQKLQKEIR
jgi:hypothetical protein